MSRQSVGGGSAMRHGKSKYNEKPINIDWIRISYFSLSLSISAVVLKSKHINYRRKLLSKYLFTRKVHTVLYNIENDRGCLIKPNPSREVGSAIWSRYVNPLISYYYGKHTHSSCGSITESPPQHRTLGDFEKVLYEM